MNQKQKLFQHWIMSRNSGVSTDSDVLSYSQRVTAAGGSLVAGDEQLLSTFVTTLKTAGIWDKLKDVGVFMGGFAGSVVKLKSPAGIENLTYTNFVSGDYSESIGLSATTNNRTAATGFIPGSQGLTQSNFMFGFKSLGDINATTASDFYQMGDNPTSGTEMYLAKTTYTQQATVTPPTNRTLTTLQHRLTDDYFAFMGSNGFINWGADFSYPYPSNVATPNLALNTEISIFKLRSGGSNRFATGRVPFYFISEYLTRSEMATLVRAVDTMLIAKGRLTNRQDLVLFGDSVTFGTGTSGSPAYVNRYAYLLATAFNLRERNMGVAGSRLNSDQTTQISGMNNRQGILNYNIFSGGKVILQYGINDMNSDANANGTPATIALVASNYTTLINELIAGGVALADIQLGSMSYVNPTVNSLVKQSAYNTAIQGVAQATGVKYAPVSEYMLANGPSGDPNNFLNDILHPNNSGHAAIAHVHQNLAGFI